jgi:hypothetical protein
MNEPGRGSDREIPIGRYTEKTTSVDENRLHVPEDVQREVGPRGDLKCPMEALRGGAPTHARNRPVPIWKSMAATNSGSPTRDR